MTADLPRVLIVEDQFLIAKQVEMILRGAGYGVAGTATNQADAIRLAAAAEPDLALVDLSLADGITGMVIGRWIAENTGAAVVFTTANMRRLPVDLCGAVGVLEKPFTKFELLSAMRYLAARLADDRHQPPRPNGLILSPEGAARWPSPASAGFGPTSAAVAGNGQ